MATDPRPLHAMPDRDLLYAALGECAIALEGAGRALGLAVALAKRAEMAAVGGAGGDTGGAEEDDDGISFAGDGRRAKERTTTNARA